jgi:hypothetical protein
MVRQYGREAVSYALAEADPLQGKRGKPGHDVGNVAQVWAFLQLSCKQKVTDRAKELENILRRHMCG